METPFKLVLGIRPKEPNFGKNFMVHFATQGDTEEVASITRAYNIAICEVMKKADLNPFHQVGNMNEIGYHGWETWSQATEATMRSLLPDIEATAHRVYTDLTGEWWKW